MDAEENLTVKAAQGAFEELLELAELAAQDNEPGKAGVPGGGPGDSFDADCGGYSGRRTVRSRRAGVYQAPSG